MANPVKSNTGAQVPLPNDPLVDEAGMITLNWYRSLIAIWQKSGGTTNESLATVSASAQAALSAANQAESQATAAVIAAATAQAEANTANANALVAQSTANTALTNTFNSLVKTSNLSDVPNIPLARQNLVLNNFAVNVTFDTLPSNLTKNVPLLQAMSLPLNFFGTITYSGAMPTASSVFTIKIDHIGVVSTIGTITITTGSRYTNILSGTATSFSAGDVLIIQAPAAPDATLAQVGITLNLTLD